MAEDVIIVDGDKIQISINSPTIVPKLIPPVALSGSGFATVSDNAVCVEGDELPSSLQSPMQYMSPPYVIPGMGTVSVTLKDANKTQDTTDKDKKILLKGSSFDAKFEVKSPAMQPSPTGPIPDPSPSYSGTATFISGNTVAEAE